MRKGAISDFSIVFAKGKRRKKKQKTANPSSNFPFKTHFYRPVEIGQGQPTDRSFR